jgi:hypothetical protein
MGHRGLRDQRMEDRSASRNGVNRQGVDRWVAEDNSLFRDRAPRDSIKINGLFVRLYNRIRRSPAQNHFAVTDVRDYQKRIERPPEMSGTVHQADPGTRARLDLKGHGLVSVKGFVRSLHRCHCDRAQRVIVHSKESY